MTFTQDWGLDELLSGSVASVWQASLNTNSDVLEANAAGMLSRVHAMADGTPAGTLIYETAAANVAESVHDVANIEKARCIGMTIESVRAGVSRIRAVTMGRAPFNHGLLTYGTKLYLPSIIDGVAGILTVVSTSGIVVARAARGHWVYFYPSVSASLV